jgi:kumamolisin
MYHPYFKYLAPNDEPALRTFYPTDLIKIYNLPPVLNPDRVNAVIVSFGGGLFGQLEPVPHTNNTFTLTNSDCDQYWDLLKLDPKPTVQIKFLGNAKNKPNDDPRDPTSENSLDVQMFGAIMPNSNITLVMADNEGQTFLDVLKATLDLKPSYVSISWGFAATPEATTFIQAIDSILKQMNSLGIQIVTAAGDAGSNDNQKQPTVDYPGSSPYVTCCGGTKLVVDDTVQYNANTQESVWNDIGSTGGGISAIFPKPKYQNDENGEYRLIPDMAGCASTYTPCYFIINGKKIPFGGTSIVAPFFAGYLARIGCKKFVNDYLYSAPRHCFHDITIGSNGAFRAGPGYDTCSGLGSIDGTLLAQYILNTSLVPSNPTQPPTQPTEPPNPTQPTQPTNPTQPTQPTSYSIVPDSLCFPDLNPRQLKCQGNGNWSSTNPNVVYVSQDGLATPIQDGSAQIMNSQANNLVNVVVHILSPTPPTLTVMPYLSLGSYLSLAATVSNCEWSSSHPEVADVKNGLVIPQKPGVTTITCKKDTLLQSITLLIGV